MRIRLLLVLVREQETDTFQLHIIAKVPHGTIAIPTTNAQRSTGLNQKQWYVNQIEEKLLCIL